MSAPREVHLPQHHARRYLTPCKDDAGNVLSERYILASSVEQDRRDAERLRTALNWAREDILAWLVHGELCGCELEDSRKVLAAIDAALEPKPSIDFDNDDGCPND